MRVPPLIAPVVLKPAAVIFAFEVILFATFKEPANELLPVPEPWKDPPVTLFVTVNDLAMFKLPANDEEPVPWPK